MKKVLFTCVLCCFAAVVAKAIPAYPQPVEITLEDGRVVMAQIHGDEYFSYATDMEGNVVRGYKPTAVDEVVVNSARRARQMEMIGSGFPLTGSPRTIAILVEFEDLSFTKTKQDFENLLMQSGYSENNATGSCRDYFIACSDSIFQPQIDVFGPYKVDESVKNSNANKLTIFKKALQLAAEDGVDFSNYDMDGNGVVDNVFFYYAGHNSAEGGPDYTIWPHAMWFTNFAIGDMNFDSYACTSELRGNETDNRQCAIGTFCHEFGHVLSLPDWYDTSKGDDSADKKDGSYTIGNWSIMCAGNYNNDSHTPPSYNAYERFYLGWLKPTQITEANQYFLEPLTTSNKAYLITANNEPHNLVSKGPSPSEFFILEYRAATGWDAPAGALPGTGMLVWHVDYKAANWAANKPNNQDPMGLHLEEAGGRKGASAASDPYPGTAKKTSFTPTMHNGTILGAQPIFKIEEKGGMIDFVYINTGVERAKVQPAELEFYVPVNDKNKPVDWYADSIIITGSDLDLGESFKITTPTTSHFFVSVDPRAKAQRTGSLWNHAAQLDSCVKEDGTINQVVYISFNPKTQSCEDEISSISIQSQTTMLSVPVVGKSPRPILITTPKMKKISNITPYSFDITWGVVEDAEKYYVTLYSADEDGTSDLVQDFENFKDKAKIQAEGWSMSSGIATTTAAVKDGKLALLLRETGDCVTSEYYPAVISKVSFWVNTLTSQADTIGAIVLEATSNGTAWDEVKTVILPKNTKSKTFSADLEVKKAYRQFRITYINHGGSGTAFDAFTATATEEIKYVYKGKQKSIAADSEEKEQTYTLTDLTPGTTYYCQLQCGENKGCEEHLSEKSAVKTATTHFDKLTLSTKEDKKIEDPIEYNRLVHEIYLPEVLEGYEFIVYDLEGHEVWRCAEADITIKNEQGSVLLPSEYFIKGKMYAAKYMQKDKMTRKDQWIKFMY